MIHLISYNIRFGKRLEDILAWLKTQVRVDILCFQEFPETKIFDCLTAFGNTSYGYSFAPSMNIRKKTYGELTLYRTDRMKLVSSTIVRLNTNTIDRFSMGRRSSRSCILTVFQMQQKKVALANIQLASLASNKLRYGQIQNIIDTLASYNIPRLLVGDFNMTSMIRRKRLIAYMRRHRYLTEVKKVATHRLIFINHQLDYVFGNNCTVETLSVERVRFSDHYPVKATLSLQE